MRNISFFLIFWVNKLYFTVPNVNTNSQNYQSVNNSILRWFSRPEKRKVGSRARNLAWIKALRDNLSVQPSSVPWLSMWLDWVLKKDSDCFCRGKNRVFFQSLRIIIRFEVVVFLIVKLPILMHSVKKEASYPTAYVQFR